MAVIRLLPDAVSNMLRMWIQRAVEIRFFSMNSTIALRRFQSVLISVHVAGVADFVDDATIRWPEDRLVVRLGQIVLTALAPNDALEQRRTIFDSIPRVRGTEASSDPLLELRAAV